MVYCACLKKKINGKKCTVKPQVIIIYIHCLQDRIYSYIEQEEL